MSEVESHLNDSAQDYNVRRSDRDDRLDLFFNLSESNKYTPRAILVDLEPSVVSKATAELPMYNLRNRHLCENGAGAGNNWKQGYEYGLNHQEELIDIIDREVDKCDNLGNFQLIHSIAGGTGSGVGSLLLELLHDRYGGKSLINTFLVFPSNEKASDVVVQPYNTVLTLKRLIEFSNGTFVFDNDALNAIEETSMNYDRNRRFTSKSTAYSEANKLIALALASISNPVRFPSYMYSSMESIILSLVPTNQLKFILTAVVPHKLNEQDIILESINNRYKLNTVSGPVKYITMMNYVIGNNVNQVELKKGLMRINQKVEFVPWCPRSINLVMGKKSPYIRDRTSAGFQASNNTSVIHVLNKTLNHYDRLAKREAYINYYTNSNNREEVSRVMDWFNECREEVQNVIEEYKQAQDISYLDEVEDYGDDALDMEEDAQFEDDPMSATHIV